MALIKAQCTNCGGILDVDESKDAAVCPFCNTPYIIEKAIDLYKTEHHTINNVYVNDAKIKHEKYTDANDRARKEYYIVKTVAVVCLLVIGVVLIMFQQPIQIVVAVLVFCSALRLILEDSRGLNPLIGTTSDFLTIINLITMVLGFPGSIVRWIIVHIINKKYGTYL